LCPNFTCKTCSKGKICAGVKYQNVFLECIERDAGKEQVNTLYNRATASPKLRNMTIRENGASCPFQFSNARCKGCRGTSCKQGSKKNGPRRIGIR
jgi:hypothetical protein